MKLSSICLRSADPEAQKDFYLDVLGMREREGGLIGYAEEEAGLLLEAVDDAYQASPEDVYWKISISVPDIDLACRQLDSSGIPVDGPRQFADVGYLAHLEDPLGFQIELIDHHFEGERPDQRVDPALLGGGPHLSLLTLRCHDTQLISEATAGLGMTPLCIVPVPDYAFTLYFFGAGNETPPNPDLYAVENRTWVYQRSHTVLEVQYRDQQTPMTRQKPDQAGYAGARVSGIGRPFEDRHLLITSAGVD